MMLGSFYFKQKARDALRGNWQTALVVTFFAGVLTTALSVVQSVNAPDPLVYFSYGQYDQFYVELMKVPDATWVALGVLGLASLLLTPALSLSCDRYFLQRLQGGELGVREGLLGRMGIWHKALWLQVIMGVKIFLWSILLVVPGILAAIRYSMAPYYLAQDPQISPSEALEKSKAVMKDKKMAYFSLCISFIGWSLAANVAQVFLMAFSTVVALVGAQFMQLAISVYMNAACASFFLTVSDEKGMSDARREMRERLREMGMNESAINQAGFGEEPRGETENDESGDEMQ